VGGLITQLLLNTLWPQTVIAQLAQVNKSTVNRITKVNDLQGRYKVARSTLRTLGDLHFSKRLWYGLIDAYNDQNGVLTSENITRIVIKTRKAYNAQKAARRKLRRERLQGVKVRRKIPRVTNKNEGMSSTEAALLALMLQSISPTPAPDEGASRRVVFHPEETP
jgi:hypothetical protein